MTPRLPSLSARDLMRALERAGFVIQRQRGSHVTLRHPVTKRTLVVPMHLGDVKRPLLKAIISESGRSETEFMALL